MSLLDVVSMSYIGRQLNVEAHNLVGIAKHVGSRSWLGHVPSLDSNSVCNTSVFNL